MERYRKTITAIFGWIVLMATMYTDGTWSAQDTILALEGLGLALGIYAVPNSSGNPLRRQVSAATSKAADVAKLFAWLAALGLSILVIERIMGQIKAPAQRMLK